MIHYIITKTLSQSKDILYRIWHLNISQIYKPRFTLPPLKNPMQIKVFLLGTTLLQSCTIKFKKKLI